jgi:hypothetical protein
VLALWIIALIILGAVLFVWVATRTQASGAFDILTQHKSPIGEKIGTAGVLLSMFGYFVAPATIGALVGAVFVSSSQVSARGRQRRAEERVQELYGKDTRQADAVAARAVAADAGESD